MGSLGRDPGGAGPCRSGTGGPWGCGVHAASMQLREVDQFIFTVASTLGPVGSPGPAPHPTRQCMWVLSVHIRRARTGHLLVAGGCENSQNLSQCEGDSTRICSQVGAWAGRWSAAGLSTENGACAYAAWTAPRPPPQRSTATSQCSSREAVKNK